RGPKPPHHLAPPAERRERQPAADDLAEHGQVGQHAVALLCPAAGDTEARDYLVEDEQGAALLTQVPHAGEGAVRGRDDSHVPGDRLDEDTGRALDPALDGLDV